MARFVTVAKADSIQPGQMIKVEIDNLPVAVANVGGAFHAFDDTCTHEDCSLAEGELARTVVTCPCHFAEFDIRTGQSWCDPRRLITTCKWSSDADDRDRRREPHRRLRGGDAARGGVRRAGGASGCGAAASVRSPAALEGVSARRDAVREDAAASARVLSRARHRDAARDQGGERRSGEADARAPGR